MTSPVISTIDDYFIRLRTAEDWAARVDMPAHHSAEECAFIVLESLAVTGNPALFTEVGNSVRQAALRELRHYRRTGRREMVYPHAGTWCDGGPEAMAAIATLAASGLVPQSMLRIATPLPKFIGVDFIDDVAPLRDRLACDDSLLDIELVGMTSEVRNATGFSQGWTMSLLLTEFSLLGCWSEAGHRRPPGVTRRDRTFPS